MKATVWIIVTLAPVLLAAVGAADCVNLRTGLSMTTAPFEPIAVVQVAAGWQPRSETSAEKRRQEASDHDVDLDVYPSDSHPKLMPGQKPGTKGTGAPNGYDAKRLNRLWGRFNGAKTNTKAEKVHKSNGQDAAVRPGRWAH